MRLVRWVALICIVLLLLYGASPYFSFWRFTVAVRSGDSAAINSRVVGHRLGSRLTNQMARREKVTWVTPLDDAVTSIS